MQKVPLASDVNAKVIARAAIAITRNGNTATVNLPQLTAKGIAAGFPYSAYKAQNYSDDLLRQHGLIV